MSRFGKNIAILLITILALVQSLVIYKVNEINNYESIVVQSNTSTQKDLLDFYEELNCLKERNIIAANEINGQWHIKLQIEGDKEHILEELSKLQVYNISDYSINHSNNINTVIVEISDKNEI